MNHLGFIMKLSVPSAGKIKQFFALERIINGLKGNKTPESLSKNKIILERKPNLIIFKKYFRKV